VDPWGRRVTGGAYAFRSPSGRFIRVTPCHGKSNVLPRARSRLKDRIDQTLAHLVVALDSDQPAAAHPTYGEPLTSRGADSVLKGEGATRSVDDEYQFEDGTHAYVVEWRALESETSLLPASQTLERLICAALIAAYPNRAEPVRTWLDSRPTAPPARAKEFAYSHMAGWYAEQGCDAFFRHIWLDELVRRELEGRLRVIGAWRVAEAVVK